jgi:hypothetical protein
VDTGELFSRVLSSRTISEPAAPKPDPESVVSVECWFSLIKAVAFCLVARFSVDCQVGSNKVLGATYLARCIAFAIAANGESNDMGKYIRHQALMGLAIAFICVAIFPFIFLYCISLGIEGIVSEQAAAKIDKFWDIIGKPYDYLIRATE